ncbi:MAG: GIY-YIG nuclease family protein [Candidatus Omnitrophota bacterium]
MFYTLVFRSQKDGRWYTGFTKDLRKRFKEHQRSVVGTTKGRGHFDLIHYEACVDVNDAV